MESFLTSSSNLIQQVKTASPSELDQLATEVRARILEVVSKTGGHLSSNLGTVELTLALYRSFNFPEEDVLVWDTGHQAYTHKLITGRADRFDTLRQIGGISGFTSRFESPYDSYGAGHVGTGVGAGLGFEQVLRKEKREGNVVVVLGDGALTNGCTLEALNQASNLNSNLRVVINDNGMSIGENVGSFARSFSLLRTNPTYATVKQRIKSFLTNTGLEPFEAILEKMRDSMKSYLVPQNLFEAIGFKYIGPIDGHDIDLLSRVFYNLKIDFKKPTIVHVVTQKGKGKDWSESQPTRYHGVGPFHLDDGSPITASKKLSFSQAFGLTLTALAAQDPKVVAVTSAMADGTGLSPFRERYPERFFDLGITESFSTLFAGVFALKDWHPVYAVYSTFLQRAYDALVHDIALQKTPVLFCVDRAGLVGDDGPTHHGVFDLGFLLTLPGATIYNPRNIRELVSTLKQTVIGRWPSEGPVFIRYPKKSEELSEDQVRKWIEEPENADALRWRTISQHPGPASEGAGRETLVFSTGTITQTAVSALSAFGSPYRLIDAARVKPLDWDAIDLCFSSPHTKQVITLEEGNTVGGFGQYLTLQLMQRHGNKIEKFLNIGLPDSFIEHGANESLYRRYRLDATGLSEQFKAFSKPSNSDTIGYLTGVWGDRR